MSTPFTTALSETLDLFENLVVKEFGDAEKFEEAIQTIVQLVERDVIDLTKTIYMTHSGQADGTEAAYLKGREDLRDEQRMVVRGNV